MPGNRPSPETIQVIGSLLRQGSGNEGQFHALKTIDSLSSHNALAKSPNIVASRRPAGLPKDFQPQNKGFLRWLAGNDANFESARSGSSSGGSETSPNYEPSGSDNPADWGLDELLARRGELAPGDLRHRFSNARMYAIRDAEKTWGENSKEAKNVQEKLDKLRDKLRNDSDY